MLERDQLLDKQCNQSICEEVQGITLQILLFFYSRLIILVRTNGLFWDGIICALQENFSFCINL